MSQTIRNQVSLKLHRQGSRQHDKRQAHPCHITNTTSTMRLLFSVAALSATLTAGLGPSSASITITGGLRFLAIVEGLAANNVALLDDFSDIIAPGYMDCWGKHLIMYHSIHSRR